MGIYKKMKRAYELNRDLHAYLEMIKERHDYLLKHASWWRRWLYKRKFGDAI